jgi:hypothetical protein
MIEGFPRGWSRQLLSLRGFLREVLSAFFLALAASFIIEGLNRAGWLFLDKPSEGNRWVYLVQLLW